MSEMDINARVKELDTEFLRTWEEGKELLDEVPRQGEEFSAEQEEKWQRMNAAMNDNRSERERLMTANQRAAEAAQIREAELSDFGEARVQHAVVQEAEAIRSWLTKVAEKQPVTDFIVPVQRAQHESMLIRGGLDASEARALAWDTGSVASAVPVTTSRTLYQYLEASIAMFRMPTSRLMTTTGEQMKFPKLGAHAIATQVSGQGTTLAGTDPTFLSMVLDAYKYGELVIIANEVLQDTVINITDFVFKDVGRALGRKIDADLVAGSGSGAPNGLMTALVGSGTIATGGSLITPTYEKLVDLVYSVNDEYRNGGSAAFLMNDTTAGTLRKLRDGAGGTVGAVLWEPSYQTGIQATTPDRLLGYPVYTDPNVASQASNNKIVAYGDMSAYYVRTVGDVAIESDASRYFDTDQTGVRGKWRVDGDLIDTTAANAMKQNV